MKRYLIFNPPKIILNTFRDHNAGLTVSVCFAMSVCLVPRAFSLFCTHLAYKRVKRLLEGVSFSSFTFQI